MPDDERRHSGLFPRANPDSLRARTRVPCNAAAAVTFLRTIVLSIYNLIQELSSIYHGCIYFFDALGTHYYFRKLNLGQDKAQAKVLSGGHSAN